MTALQRAFQTAFAGRRADGFSFNPLVMLTLGCETRRVPAEYYWEGARRREKEAPKRFVFQCGFEGGGVYEEAGKRWTLGKGQAFMTLLPSRHVYYLPEGSPVWSFYWFTIAHPYVVERLEAARKEHGPIVSVPAEASLHRHSLSLFERCCQQRFEDGLEEEGMLFEWMLALLGHLRDAAHPRGQREALIEELRRFTLENLRRSFGVEDFARRSGLSRSHYSHQFREVTGLSPAAFILAVRLGEVRRLLRQTDSPLKDIASSTGFADANHLCKAFRRLYHSSPGAYRRGLK